MSLCGNCSYKSVDLNLCGAGRSVEEGRCQEYRDKGEGYPYVAQGDNYWMSHGNLVGISSTYLPVPDGGIGIPFNTHGYVDMQSRWEGTCLYLYLILVSSYTSVYRVETVRCLYKRETDCSIVDYAFSDRYGKSLMILFIRFD